MAIQFCTECGKQVSDRAAACPHCGNPTGAPAPTPSKVEPAVVTVRKNSHPVLTFIGGAVLVVVGLLVVLYFVGRKPKFEVTDKITDTNCTQLTDFCIDVNCTYQNSGAAGGTQRVRAQLLDKNTGAVRADHYSDLTLAPGASQRLTFSFPEAELDWEVSSVCKVDSGASGSN